MIIDKVFATAVSACVALSCNGQAGDEQGVPASDNPLAVEVYAALDGYASGTSHGRNDAKRAFRSFTEAHVPILRKVLESNERRLTSIAVGALSYMHDDASFELLIDTLESRTSVAMRQLAASAMLDRITVHGGLTEHLKSNNNLQTAVQSYLSEADGPHALKQAIRLAMVVDCNSCVPTLRRCATNADLEVRLLAARAANAITGDEIEVDVPQEQFPRVALDEGFVSVVRMIEVAEGTITSAAAAPPRNGKVGAIASILRHSDEDTCRVVAFDSNTNRRVLFEAPLILHEIIISPDEADEVPWMVARAARHEQMTPSLAVAFSKDGNCLWRFEVPAQYRGMNAIAWEYDDKGISGVALACARQGNKDAVICLDLAGQEVSRHELSFAAFNLASSPCVPDRVLRGTGGYGSVRLLDNSGKIVAQGPDPASYPSISDAAFVQIGNTDWGMAASQRAEHSVPSIVCFDKGFRPQWSVTLSRPVLAFGTLANSCENSGYVVAMTEDFELLVLDADGVLRWRRRLWSEAKTPEPFLIYHLDAGSGNDATSPTLVIYSSHRAALLTLH